MCGQWLWLPYYYTRKHTCAHIAENLVSYICDIPSKAVCSSLHLDRQVRAHTTCVCLQWPHPLHVLGGLSTPVDLRAESTVYLRHYTMSQEDTRRAHLSPQRQPHSRLPACSSPPLAKECPPGQEKETPVLGQKETPLPGQDEKETLEPARKRNRCDEDAKEDDDDPAIFILFSSWDIIHRILLNPVPTPYTGVPAAGTGVNAVATSFTWFADFLDRLAIQVGMTQDNFVRDADRKREPGVSRGEAPHGCST